MITFRRLRPLKRQIFILCIFTVGMIWFHQYTSVQMVGNFYQHGQISARIGIVYEWMKYEPNFNKQQNHAHIDQQSIETKIAQSERQDLGESHPFENSCQYPVLYPEDENLHHVIKHTRLHVCKRVQDEILIFDYDRGELIFNRSLATQLYPQGSPRCQYRPFTGGIRPRMTDYSPIGEWIPIDQNITKIDHDLIETKCFAKFNTSRPIPQPKYAPRSKDGQLFGEELIYRFAFGQIVKRNETSGNHSKPYVKNDEHTLSIDFLFLDSTAYNMMRRHMPKSWAYMKDAMGVYHLDGYMKVGDNSMVNLMPILAGLRYGDQADDMPTEVPIDHPIDVEPIPFLWKFFRERGCATMFNDDIADYTRGFLSYPWTHVRGFAEYPTDHFIRPWHIYHRRYSIPRSSKFCFGNHPYTKLQLSFLEQMIKKYHDTCHFSFNFITELPHDDPNNLELADDNLHGILHRLYTGNYLNNTILFIMGDHGNRIGYVMYSYVGRIEERMTLFSVYIPEWYRKKYPQAMKHLENNQRRLTSNYDVHRMIKELFYDTLSHPTEPSIDSKLAVSKGVSLFRPIPTNRTCNDANVPPQHCACLEAVPTWASSSKLFENHTLYQWSKNVILNWTRIQLEDSKCRQIDDIDILDIKALTTSQMIQHGVRDQTKDQMKRLQRRIDGEIEYIDVIYTMKPIDITARTRLQHYKKLSKKKLFINIPPYPHPSKRALQIGNNTLWFC